MPPLTTGRWSLLPSAAERCVWACAHVWPVQGGEVSFAKREGCRVSGTGRYISEHFLFYKVLTLCINLFNTKSTFVFLLLPGP
jgi:hypothetical protein